MRAIALWGTCGFLWVTDRPALSLGEELRMRGLNSGMKALTAYAFPIQIQFGHWSHQLQDPAQVVAKNILANFG